MRFSVLLALALTPLAACSTVAEAVRGPELAPIGYPAALMPAQQTVLSAPGMTPIPASANSLWRSGARAFFVDQRAARVGDILTVQIEINDSATTQNKTTTSRTASQTMGVPHFFGLENSLGKLLPGGFDPAAAIETGSNSAKAGAGAVNRSEKISLTVAAVVTGVLPNGNLVIQGTQEVMTNGELRRLTVSGIVRPEDISAANTVKHTQIAEARIAYGGRGDISRQQRTPAGQAITERFSPF
ncbi:MAG: flagellar basal body L-ring protein FlgH [Caulobacter sp.]|nr:flagellar basal body L-ring protein FlgH [Caulobacter sp.]